LRSIVNIWWWKRFLPTCYYVNMWQVWTIQLAIIDVTWSVEWWVVYVAHIFCYCVTLTSHMANQASFLIMYLCFYMIMVKYNDQNMLYKSQQMRVGGSIKTQLSYDRDLLVLQWLHVSAMVGHLQVINSFTINEHTVFKCCVCLDIINFDTEKCVKQ
jgi:hypothetical protein